MEVTYRHYGSNALRGESAAIWMSLFKDAPLYDKQELSRDLWEACLELLYFDGFKIDTWCVDCNKESTFSLKRLATDQLIANNEAWMEDHKTYERKLEVNEQEIEQNLHWLLFTCARQKYHKITYVCVRNVQFHQKKSVTESFAT